VGECRRGNVNVREAGFDARACRVDASFTAHELKKLGYQPEQLKAAGFEPRECFDAGVNLAAAGFTVDALRTAGFTAAEVQAGTNLQHKEMNHTQGAFFKKFFGPKSHPGAASLQEQGKSCYSPTEFRSAGYTPKECADAKINALGAGFTALECKIDGFKVANLKALGYAPTAIRDADYTAKECQQAGVPLRAAGFGATELHRLSWSLEELYKEGYTAKECKHAGFTELEALKAVGFSARAMLDAGFHSAQLYRMAGYSLEELRRAGVSAKELTRGAHLQRAGQLLDAGFPKDDVLALFGEEEVENHIAEHGHTVIPVDPKPLERQPTSARSMSGRLPSFSMKRSNVQGDLRKVAPFENQDADVVTDVVTPVEDLVTPVEDLVTPVEDLNARMRGAVRFG